MDKYGQGFKLTQADADEIRQRVMAGESRASVAASYDIGVQHVSAIMRGKHWTNWTRTPHKATKRS